MTLAIALAALGLAALALAFAVSVRKRHDYLWELQHRVNVGNSHTLVHHRAKISELEKACQDANERAKIQLH